MERRAVPLVLQKDPNKEAEELQANLYFKGDGDVPYVAVSEFLPFFGSLYQNETLGNHALEFSFEDNDGVLWATRADNKTQMLIDPKADTIEFVDYDAFVQSPGDTALVPLVTIGSTGYGGSMSLLKDAGSYNRHGLLTTFDLNRYGIDIVADNGEKVFVYAYGCDLSEQIQSVPTAQMSEAYAEFNYNELVFLLDSFYGLKPEHNIDSFYKFIPNMGLEQKLASTDPDEFDMGLAELTLRYLDDQHSGFFLRTPTCLRPVTKTL